MNAVLPSSLFAVLPSVIQSRIPKLFSLRSTVNRYGSLGYAAQAESDCHSPSCQLRSEPRNLPSACLANTQDVVVCSVPTVLDSNSTTSLRSWDQRQQCPSTPFQSTSETNTGITWKYVNQGLSLLAQSFQESLAVSSGSDQGDPLFVRQLYLHGVSYLLRGLPTDLRLDERLSIRCALPLNVVEPLHVQGENQEQLRTPNIVSPVKSIEAPQSLHQTSLLHQFLKVVLHCLVLFVRFTLPHIKQTLSAIYIVERRHRISERIFLSTLKVMNYIGHTSVALASAVLALNEGKVGEALTDNLTWWISEISERVGQGSEESPKAFDSVSGQGVAEAEQPGVRRGR